MTNEELLATIKIKLIKDPVNIGQQMERQVAAPSMMRNVLSNAALALTMRGVAGMGKGIKVNPKRIRGDVRLGPPIGDPNPQPSRGPMDGFVKPAPTPQLPSTSTLIPRKGIGKPFPQRIKKPTRVNVMGESVAERMARISTKSKAHRENEIPGVRKRTQREMMRDTFEPSIKEPTIKYTVHPGRFIEKDLQYMENTR